MEKSVWIWGDWYNIKFRDRGQTSGDRGQEQICATKGMWRPIRAVLSCVIQIMASVRDHFVNLILQCCSSPRYSCIKNLSTPIKKPAIEKFEDDLKVPIGTSVKVPVYNLLF